MKKKYILLLLTFMVQGTRLFCQAPPLIATDTNGTIKYVMMQFSLSPAGCAMNTKDSSMRIVFSNINSIETTSKWITDDRILAVRVLDTINQGATLRNTIYPYPVFIDSSVHNAKVVVSSDSTIDFSEVKLDMIKTKTMYLVNAGNSPLVLPKGMLYDKLNRELAEDSLGKVFIGRKIWTNELEWQIRDENQELDSINKLNVNDNLDVVVNPGDSLKFYIDVKPRYIGLMSDSLYLIRSDGLDNNTIVIPMIMKGTWTINYSFGETYRRPCSGDRSKFNGKIKIPIVVSNNKGTRTRISSIDFTIKYNVANLFIENVEFEDSKLHNWEKHTFWYDSQEYRTGTEYGNFRIIASAKMNRDFLNSKSNSWLDSVQSGFIPYPDSTALDYLSEGSYDISDTIGWISGIVLLGDSNETDIVIDTSISQHNQDTSVALFKAYFGDKIPFIKTIKGKVVVDSLIFFEERRLYKNQSHSALIVNVFPNPFSNIINIEYEVFVESDVLIELVDEMGKICKVIPIPNLKNGKYSVVIDTDSIPAGSYFVVLKSSEENDIRSVVNIK